MSQPPPCVLLNEFFDFGVSVDVARRNNSLVGPWPSNSKKFSCNMTVLGFVPRFKKLKTIGKPNE